MNLPPPIAAAIAGMGFVHPTPIQSLAIPPARAGKDLIAMAATGSGKTLAFGVPLLERIDPRRSAVQGLVLCPTRELAQQVSRELERIAAGSGVRVQLIVGGELVGEQMIDFKQTPAQVVVGTPGRILDLCQRRYLSISWVEVSVLDEADEMLDMGFIDDVRSILERTPDERQTLLFSATFPEPLKRLAREMMHSPIEVSTVDAGQPVASITQYMAIVDERDIPRKVNEILRSDPAHTYLVFCERKRDVDALYSALIRRRVSVAAIHGDFKQSQRWTVMEEFRSGKVRALIATDIAARGLDISHITHVVNVGVPREPERYVHRVGRTGRAGRDGIAITLLTPRERTRWRAIVARLGREVPQLPANLGAAVSAPAEESAEPEQAPREREAAATRAPRERDAAPTREPREREAAPSRSRRDRDAAPTRAPRERDAAPSRTRREREDAPTRAPRERDAAPTRAPRERDAAPSRTRREREDTPTRAPREREAAPVRERRRDEVAPTSSPAVEAPPSSPAPAAPPPADLARVLLDQPLSMESFLRATVGNQDAVKRVLSEPRPAEEKPRRRRGRRRRQGEDGQSTRTPKGDRASREQSA